MAILMRADVTADIDALIPYWGHACEALAERNAAYAGYWEARAKHLEASARYYKAESRAEYWKTRANVVETFAKWEAVYTQFTAASAKLNEAYAKWTETVRTVCGPDASIEWTDTGCIVLGVMEFLY